MSKRMIIAVSSNRIFKRIRDENRKKWVIPEENFTEYQDLYDAITDHPPAVLIIDSNLYFYKQAQISLASKVPFIVESKGNLYQLQIELDEIYKELEENPNIAPSHESYVIPEPVHQELQPEPVHQELQPELTHQELQSKSPHQELQPEPVHQELQSEPVHQELQEPVHQELQSEPVHQELQSEPVHQELQSKPTHQELQSEPTHQEPQSEPTHQEPQSEPTHQEPQSEPTHQEPQSEPTHQEPQSEPTHQEPQSEPTKQVSEMKEESTTKRQDIFGKSKVELSEEIRKNLLSVVICSWGACGGIGKTELAKNLALYLGKEFRVCLLDFNTPNPDIGDHFGINISETKNLYDAYLLWSAQKLNRSQLDGLFTDFHGIKVLPGIGDVIQQGDMEWSFFIHLVQEVRQLFDLVIIDMDNDISSPAGLYVLKQANQVLVTVTTSTSVLGHTMAYLPFLHRAKIDDARIQLVLNHRDPGGVVDENVILSKLGKKPMAEIPYNPKHQKAIDNAKPLVLSDRKLEKALQPLAKGILEFKQAVSQVAVTKNKNKVNDTTPKRIWSLFPKRKELK